MTSNGRNINYGQYTADPTAECALTSVFRSFPANLSSVMALSSSPYTLPTYLSPPLLKILSLCLRRTFSALGVLFYGIGPYYLLP
ncbi:basic 7S globulin 2-like protein [Tanacetum coccineum]